MDATPMIHLDRVTKVYPGTAVPAVEELTLDVHKGEILVLVGPSGCGKSTTLRPINRMIEPSGGHIYFEGEDATDVDADRLRRRIAVSYTHLRAHETGRNLVCRLLLEKK